MGAAHGVKWVGAWGEGAWRVCAGGGFGMMKMKMKKKTKRVWRPLRGAGFFRWGFRWLTPPAIVGRPFGTWVWWRAVQRAISLFLRGKGSAALLGLRFRSITGARSKKRA